MCTTSALLVRRAHSCPTWRWARLSAHRLARKARTAVHTWSTTSLATTATSILPTPTTICALSSARVAQVTGIPQSPLPSHFGNASTVRRYGGTARSACTDPQLVLYFKSPPSSGTRRILDGRPYVALGPQWGCTHYDGSIRPLYAKAEGTALFGSEIVELRTRSATLFELIQGRATVTFVPSASSSRERSSMAFEHDSANLGNGSKAMESKLYGGAEARISLIDLRLDNPCTAAGRSASPPAAGEQDLCSVLGSALTCSDSYFKLDVGLKFEFEVDWSFPLSFTVPKLGVALFGEAELNIGFLVDTRTEVRTSGTFTAKSNPKDTRVSPVEFCLLFVPVSVDIKGTLHAEFRVADAVFPPFSAAFAINHKYRAELGADIKRGAYFDRSEEKRVKPLVFNFPTSKATTIRQGSVDLRLTLVPAIVLSLYGGVFNATVALRPYVGVKLAWGDKTCTDVPNSVTGNTFNPMYSTYVGIDMQAKIGPLKTPTGWVWPVGGREIDGTSKEWGPVVIVPRTFLDSSTTIFGTTPFFYLSGCMFQPNNEEWGPYQAWKLSGDGWDGANGYGTFIRNAWDKTSPATAYHSLTQMTYCEESGRYSVFMANRALDRAEGRGWKQVFFDPRTKEQLATAFEQVKSAGMMVDSLSNAEGYYQVKLKAHPSLCWQVDKQEVGGSISLQDCNDGEARQRWVVFASKNGRDFGGDPSRTYIALGLKTAGSERLCLTTEGKLTKCGDQPVRLGAQSTSDAITEWGAAEKGFDLWVDLWDFAVSTLNPYHAPVWRGKVFSPVQIKVGNKRCNSESGCRKHNQFLSGYQCESGEWRQRVDCFITCDTYCCPVVECPPVTLDEFRSKAVSSTGSPATFFLDGGKWVGFASEKTDASPTHSHVFFERLGLTDFSGTTSDWLNTVARVFSNTVTPSNRIYLSKAAFSAGTLTWGLVIKRLDSVEYESTFVRVKSSPGGLVEAYCSRARTHALAYGAGFWVASFAGAPIPMSGSEPGEIVKYSSNWPSEWIKAKYQSKYLVAASAYGDGQYVVVMQKLKTWCPTASDKQPACSGHGDCTGYDECTCRCCDRPLSRLAACCKPRRRPSALVVQLGLARPPLQRPTLHPPLSKWRRLHCS
jgi:hypothetical protein